MKDTLCMDINFIDSLSEKHLADLEELFSDEWWTKGRKVKDIRKMVDNSDILYGYEDRARGTLIAFGRILTDYTFRALLLDVVVAPVWRSKGLGTLLMDKIIDDPRLGKVQEIQLHCHDDVITFYERWGFTVAEPDILLMKRVKGG